MPTPHQNTPLVLKSEATPNELGTTIIGTFTLQVFHENSPNDLDDLEAPIELAGQEFKRQTCSVALVAADQRCSQLFQQTQPPLTKNGKPTFTIIARFGEVKIKRQRLRDTRTGKTYTPSAILWQTARRRHLTQAVCEAACNASQEVSYRKAAEQLAENAGTEQLISTSTVWNKKQEKGKKLEQQQNHFVHQVQSGKEVTLHAGVPSDSTCRIEEGTIQVP